MKSEKKKKTPSVLDLIDRYVPVKTQAQFTRMCMQYEKEVTDLLMQLHRLHRQHESLCEAYSGLQDDYGAQSLPAVSMGRVMGDTNYNAYERSYNCRIQWSPEPFQQVFPCPEHAVDHELPYLMEAAKKVFVAKLTEYLEREMEHTLGKMWYESKRR